MKWNLSEVKNTIYKIKHLLDYISSRLDIRGKERSMNLKALEKRNHPNRNKKRNKRKKNDDFEIKYKDELKGIK